MSASYRGMLLWMLPFVMVPVLLLDGMLLRVIARQSLSAFHLSAPGTITHSRLVDHGDTEGSSYGLEVRYAYEVRGRAYEGSQYRYGAWSSSNKSVAEDLERRFPVGARVPVFYDPESPEDAVLITGLDGMYLYLLLCMTPLNIGMLVGLWHALRGRDESELGVFKRAGRVHVRLTGETTALAVGVMALGIASFVSIFVLGFVMWFSPSLMAAVLTWGVVIATSVFFARKQRAKLALHDSDLILDERNRMLSLPAAGGRGRLNVPWSKVKSIFIEQHTRDLGEGETVTFWCPTLVIAAKRNEVLVQWSDGRKAALLVKWLEGKLTPRGGPG